MLIQRVNSYHIQAKKKHTILNRVKVFSITKSQLMLVRVNSKSEALDRRYIYNSISPISVIFSSIEKVKIEIPF